MFLKAKFNGKTVEIMDDGMAIYLKEDDGDIQNDSLEHIGNLYKNDKEPIAKWIAVDIEGKLKTFAPTREKAILQLVDKIAKSRIQLIDFHHHQLRHPSEKVHAPKREIELGEALYRIQSNTIDALGFNEAKLLKLPEWKPIEQGWLDLKNQDCKPQIFNHHIQLETWFNGMFDADLIVESRTEEFYENINQLSRKEQCKMEIVIDVEDIDFIIADGQRQLIKKA